MSLTRQYQSVKDGVVQVLAMTGQQVLSFGSGSVIATGQYVLTCAHCIVPGAQIAIADGSQSGRAIYGSVLFSEPTIDIAILEFPQSVGNPVAFTGSAGCSIGDGAFVVGFPMGIQEQVLLSAHIASVTPGYLRIDASVNHGNSGGPLFNLTGEQIGVVNAKHGSLSNFLTQLMNYRPGMSMHVGGVDPVQSIQILIAEMQKNLNLGIGYAVPTAAIKPLHPILAAAIP